MTDTLLHDAEVQMIVNELEFTLGEAAERMKIDVRSIMLFIVDSNHNATAALKGCGCPHCAGALVLASAKILQVSLNQRG